MTKSRILNHTGIFKIAAWITIISLVFLSFANTNMAKAADITSVSDQISDSDVSVVSNHLVTFTTPTGVAEGQTITLDFNTASFTTTGMTEDDVDIADDGVDLTTAVDCAQVGAEKVSVALAAGVFTITICAGDGGAIAAASVVTVELGSNATASGTGSNQITNPGTTGQKDIAIAGTMTDSGTATVAIVDDIAVTADIANIFTFTIAGVASGQTGANGEATTTDITTAATTIPWGTLTANSAKNANHNLTVVTNASNGFTVGVFKDTELINNQSDTINIFDDGVDGAPAAWSAPAGTAGSADTYGHMGITSDDATLGSSCGSDTFGSALYDAIPTATSSPTTGMIEVMCHTVAADGTGTGAATVGYKIEIDALQEAGNYSNTLSYIATPTF